MHNRVKTPLALLALTLVCLAGATALGAQVEAPPSPPPAPPVVHPLVDHLFAYLGMAAAALSTLAAILPKTWRLTQLCARFSVDLRGILTPDPSDDPEWAKRIKRDPNVMLIFGVLLAPLGCAFFRDSVAPVVAECAPDREYVIDGLTQILDGADAFEVLDRLKNEKGPELVLCALRRFLDRVAVSPETATQRERARLYLARE